MNKSISELDELNNVSQHDMLLISQKTENGYVSKRVDASGFRGESAYDIWKTEQTSQVKYLMDTSLLSAQKTSGKTPSDFVKDSQLQSLLEAFSKKDTSVINKFLTVNNLTAEYSAYQKQAGMFSSFQEFLEKNSLHELFSTFIKNNLDFISSTFVNSVTMADVYNDYYNTEVIKKFITESNLTQLFEDYKEENSYYQSNIQKLFNDFIEKNNYTNIFDTYITNNNITTENIVNNIINKYDLISNYNNWVDNRTTNITVVNYNEAVAPKVTKVPAIAEWEDFWICLFSNSVPKDATGLGLIINRIAIPDMVILDADDLQLSSVKFDGLSVGDSVPNILMKGDFSRFIGKDSPPSPMQYEIPLNIAVSSDHSKVELPLDKGEKILISSPQVIEFSLESTPSTDMAISLTLKARKRKLVPADSAVIKLSGQFKITDSINGSIISAAYMDYYGARDAHMVSSLGVHNWQKLWAKDLKVVTEIEIIATGYDQKLQGATVYVKNNTDSPRSVRFSPVGFNGMGDGTFTSSLDNTVFDLPPNAIFDNGDIVVSLAPKSEI